MVDRPRSWRAGRFARLSFRRSGGERKASSSFRCRSFAPSNCSLVISRHVLEACRCRGRPHRSQRLYQLSSVSKAAPAERAWPIIRHIASSNALISDMAEKCLLRGARSLFALLFIGGGRDAAGRRSSYEREFFKCAGELQQKRLFRTAGVTFRQSSTCLGFILDRLPMHKRLLQADHARAYQKVSFVQ